MKKNKLTKIICLCLSAAVIFSFAGCGAPGEQEPGNTGSIPVREAGGDAPGNGSPAGNGKEISEAPEPGPEDPAVTVADFGLRLLQYCMEGSDAFPPQASMPQNVYEALEDEKENVLISPLSVISALTMTANGAKEDTLRQMEEAFGADTASLSMYLSDCRSKLPSDERYRLNMANAIWYSSDERFNAEEDFLRMSEAFFGAIVREAPFDDSTAKEINEWVSEQTEGMIGEILDKIPADAVMYLINALAFDAEWQNIYRESQVREGAFTTEDGTVRTAEMMYSEERLYLKDEHAEGFLKYYADERYAFAALLPEAGMTVREYVSSLNGEKLLNILSAPEETVVDAAIPKFTGEYDISLNDILIKMGMRDAFDSNAADLSGIGASTEGNLFISRVLHKTFIAVDERGTKAGAATAVEIQDECAVEYPHRIYLNRPFVYMIIDTETKLPIFMGTLTDVSDFGPED